MSINEPKLPNPATMGTTASFHKKFGGGVKIHKQASEEVRSANEVKSKDIAKVVVSLFSCPLRKEAMRRATELDGWIREVTLPWGNDGRRYVANTIKDRFDEHANFEIKECDKLMDQHFDFDNWSKLERVWKVEAGRLGVTGMEFPNREIYMGKYELRIDPGTIIDVDNIQPGAMTTSARERFMKDVRAAEKRRVMDGMKVLTDRIVRTIGEVVKIENYGVDKDGKKIGKFQDSRIGNVSKLADALENLNVTGDPEIEKIRKDIINEIACHSPADLRENQQERNEVVKSAKDILARAGLFGRKSDD